MKSPGSRIVFKWLITAFMLLSGLLVSTYVYVEQRAGEQALAEAEWQKEAYEQGVRASLLFTRATQIGRGFAALFTVSDLVTGDEFARYARYMVRVEHEIAAIMWTPYVSATQRAEFEQQLRQDTGHQLGIIDLVEPGHHRVRAPQRDYYLPIHFLSQSVQVDPGLIGLDVHGRPGNEALRRQSMQTGLAFTTPVFANLSHPGAGKSVAIYYPVSVPGRSEPMPGSGFRGFVILLLTPQVLLQNEFGSPRQSRFVMQLVDRDDQDRVIASNRPLPQTHQASLRFDYPIAIPERRWVLTIYGYDALPVSHTAHWLLLCLLTLTLVVVIGTERSIERYLRLKSQNRKLERQRIDLRQQANSDSLTGLYNRRYFQQRLETLLQQPDRSFEIAICLMDLDNFKQVNDQLSHSHGDRLLQRVAQALLAETCLGDLVARLGGDEFILAFPLSNGIGELPPILERLQQRITELADEVSGGQVPVSASFGVSLSGAHCCSYTTLFHHADLAMYAAKHSGKQTYRFYSSALESSAME